MKIIINLSALLTLKSFPSRINAFTALCDKYADDCLTTAVGSCMPPGFFSPVIASAQHYTNKTWVYYHYTQ